MSAPTSTTPTTPADGHAPEQSDRRRWFALVVVCLGVFMNALDASIVNVALPSIQRELHLSQSSLTWVVDAYLITFGSCLLLAGRLGDLVGRRRIFLTGIVVFTLASAMCGLAQDGGVLIAGRFLQGIGGAMSTSVIVAIIVTEFPKATERAKAMSAYVFVAVGGGSIGLLVGGILTQEISWHWIFFINVPVGIVTFVLGRVLIVENKGIGTAGGVDWAGSVLITVALMVGIYAIVTVPQYGWVSAHTLGVGAVAVVLLTTFVVLESHLAHPIMPLRVFRIPSLARSSIVRGFLNTGMFSTFFLGALYLENVLGYTPLRTGAAFLPVTATMGTLSTGITARLVRRFGNKPVLLPGIVACGLGLLLLTQAGPDANYWTDLLPAFLLLGIGAGTSFVPLLAIAMHDIPSEDAGLGSGVVNVSMQVAAAVGLAVLSTVATNRSHTLAAQGADKATALSGGYHLSFFIGAICVAVGLVIAILALHEPEAHPDEDEARTLEIEQAGELL